MQITTADLAAMVASHTRWLSGHADGRQAILRGADLSGANLSGAYLSGANLSGVNLMGETIQKPPLQLSGLRWPVVITEKFMVIGCRRHSHVNWSAMDDAEISQMHPAAPAFWTKHKTALMAICELHAGADR